MTSTRKVLLAAAALGALVLAGILAYESTRARWSREETTSDLQGTQAVWEDYEAERLADLARGVRALANDPYFKPLAESGDIPTIADTLAERGSDIGADLLVVANARGSVIASSSRRNDGGGLMGSPLVSVPLGQRQVLSGLFREGDTWLQAVGVPLQTGGEIHGVLIAGYKVDEAQALRLSRVNRSEIAFVAQAAGEEPRIRVSTLAEREPALAERLRTLPADTSEAVFELDLQGEPWLAIQTPVRDVGGQQVGSLMALRSVSAPFSARRAASHQARNATDQGNEERD